MKLTFIRADHEVTGSCTLLEIGGHYGLIDCGMQQGRDQFENIDIPVPAAQIEFVLVTHAHMDHTGHLPLLYKQGFRGTVYATEATCDLCGIMLRSTRELAHVAYYMVAYTLDMQELCRVYRAVLDGLTDGCVPEAIACWSAWSDRVTLRYREALEQLQSA